MSVSRRLPAARDTSFSVLMANGAIQAEIKARAPITAGKRAQHTRNSSLVDVTLARYRRSASQLVLTGVVAEQLPLSAPAIMRGVAGRQPRNK
jgi:hypothetical protein